MHKEILSGDQMRLLPLVRQFKREYYLTGGTAIALYAGHRRSIDFELFKINPLNHKKIISKISEFGFPFSVTRRVTDQLNVNVMDVKFTISSFLKNFLGLS